MEFASLLENEPLRARTVPGKAEMRLTTPSMASVVLAVMIFTSFTYFMLHNEFLDHWDLHRFSWPALLEGRFSDVWTRIRPASHEIYPYRAYYDHLLTPPAYRILAISKCLFDNTNFAIEVDNKKVSAQAFYTAGPSCPHPFVATYAWQTEELSAASGVRAKTIKLLVNSTRTVVLPVAERPRTVERGKVEVCFNVAAFWYDDWPRLIVFIELWRAAHNAQFTLYVKSISKSVQKVLDFYAKTGFLRVFPWPDIPTSTGVENANKDSFNLQSTIVQNDCLIRSNAEVAVLLDIDEFLYIKNNQSLLEFMRTASSKIPNLGAFSFPTIGMEMAMLDGSFEAIGTESILRNVMHKKVGFSPNRVKTLSTHNVNEFVGHYKQYDVKAEDAVIVHMRQNLVRRDYSSSKVSTLPFFTPAFRNTLLARERAIFGEQLPPFYPRRVAEAVTRCYARMLKEHPNRYSGLRNVPGECREDVRGLEEWIEYGASEDSQFYVV